VLCSLDIDAKTAEEKAQFYAHRVLHVHFSVKQVLSGNIRHVSSTASNVNTPPSISVHRTRGGRCANLEGEVNQIPAMGTFVHTLEVNCTANGLGYSQLTSVLNIANGTPGTIIANLHCPVQQNLLVCIVDFPSYKGPSLIGKNWPSTWVPVAQVTKICEHGCCERTGFPLTPGNHVTLFKCQGITCGKGRQKEKMLLHCEDLHEGEKRWPRSFYVALTRTVNASDLAFINIVGLKKDLWESINNARYHKSAKEQRTQDTQLSQKTLQRMKKYTTDAGWVEFLLLVDELANDGIHDGRCNANDKAQCARMGCAACKLETSKKDRPTR